MAELNLAAGKELELKEKVRQQVVAGDLTLFNQIKDIYGFKIEDFVTDMHSIRVSVIIYTTLPVEHVNRAEIKSYFSDQLDLATFEDTIKDLAYSDYTTNPEYDEEDDDVIYDSIFGSFFNVEFQVED